eukprot:XP_001700528.1 predicted protein [Chlamydomonas reinhardtii]
MPHPQSLPLAVLPAMLPPLSVLAPGHLRREMAQSLIDALQVARQLASHGSDVRAGYLQRVAAVQYADDTKALLEGEQEVVAFLAAMHTFQHASGQRLNLSKVQLLRIGAADDAGHADFSHLHVFPSAAAPCVSYITSGENPLLSPSGAVVGHLSLYAQHSPSPGEPASPLYSPYSATSADTRLPPGEPIRMSANCAGRSDTLRVEVPQEAFNCSRGSAGGDAGLSELHTVFFVTLQLDLAAEPCSRPVASAFAGPRHDVVTAVSSCTYVTVTATCKPPTCDPPPPPLVPRHLLAGPAATARNAVLHYYAPEPPPSRPVPPPPAAAPAVAGGKAGAATGAVGGLVKAREQPQPQQGVEAAKERQAEVQLQGQSHARQPSPDQVQSQEQTDDWVLLDPAVGAVVEGDGLSAEPAGPTATAGAAAVAAALHAAGGAATQAPEQQGPAAAAAVPVTGPAEDKGAKAAEEAIAQWDEVDWGDAEDWAAAARLETVWSPGGLARLLFGRLLAAMLGDEQIQAVLAEMEAEGEEGVGLWHWRVSHGRGSSGYGEDSDGDANGWEEREEDARQGLDRRNLAAAAEQFAHWQQYQHQWRQDQPAADWIPHFHQHHQPHHHVAANHAPPMEEPEQQDADGRFVLPLSCLGRIRTQTSDLAARLDTSTLVAAIPASQTGPFPGRGLRFLTLDQRVTLTALTAASGCLANLQLLLRLARVGHVRLMQRLLQHQRRRRLPLDLAQLLAAAAEGCDAATLRRLLLLLPCSGGPGRGNKGLALQPGVAAQWQQQGQQLVVDGYAADRIVAAAAGSGTADWREKPCTKACSAAAALLPHGEALSRLRWLHLTAGCPVDWSATTAAARAGNEGILRFLLRREGVEDQAAQQQSSGQPQRLAPAEDALGRGPRARGLVPISAAYHAAARGHLGCLRLLLTWLAEQGQAPRDLAELDAGYSAAAAGLSVLVCSPRVMNAAAASGSVAAVQLLLEAGAAATRSAFEAAAAAGCEAVLEYLAAAEGGVLGSDGRTAALDAAATAAARRRDARTLRTLVSLGWQPQLGSDGVGGCLSRVGGRGYVTSQGC